MKKTFWKKIVAVVMTVAVLATAMPVRVWADEECQNGIKTNLFGCIEDDKDGKAMFTILGIVLNVLTVGVGVLGVLGIVISGVQYLTARDNEAQMAKARKRILEVVIGLVVYAVMYLVLSNLLIPGGI